MMTVGGPLNVQFQPNISKIERITALCAALSAGPALFADQVLRRVRQKLTAAGAPASVEQVCTAVNEEYVAFREEKVEEQIIRPLLGYDFAVFRAKGGTLPAYLQVQSGMYQQIVVQASQHNLGLDVMIAGFGTAGCVIATVTHPGTMYYFTKIGYNAIGTGSVHAAVKFYLGGQTPQSSLPETIFAVYDAKRAAEVAPGVGPDSDMMVISATGLLTLPPAFLEELGQLHAAQMKRQVPKLDLIKKLYDQLAVPESGGANPGGVGSTAPEP